MSVFVFFGIVGIVLVLFTLELVRQGRLKERFAAIWVAFAVTAAIGALSPGAVTWLSDRLGFEVPANLVISGAIIALAFVAIQVTLELTRLRDAVERLTTRLAIVETESASNPTDDGDKRAG